MTASSNTGGARDTRGREAAWRVAERSRKTRWFWRGWCRWCHRCRAWWGLARRAGGSFLRRRSARLRATSINLMDASLTPTSNHGPPSPAKTFSSGCHSISLFLGLLFPMAFLLPRARSVGEPRRVHLQRVSGLPPDLLLENMSHGPGKNTPELA